MSGEEVAVAVPAVEPVVAAATIDKPMDVDAALRLVLKKSLASGGLVRGLHECVKVIEKNVAQLCVYAEDCNQPDYMKLIKALCSERNVSFMKVESAKALGEMCGLCKIDSEGNARKVVGCSCAVVKDYGEVHEGLHILQEHLKSMQ